MSVALGWAPRAAPLAPRATVAEGAVARRLARHLLAAPSLAGLRGVATADLLVCLGDPPPWVDGVLLLGVDPDAPGLLLPTYLAPTPPIPLVEAALRRDAPPGPLAVLPAGRRLVPLGDARALDAARLRRWLDA